MKKLSTLLLTGVFLASCSTISETTPPDLAFDYASVFVADDRPEKDFEMYEVRKSKEVLEFMAIKPGMTVVDMEAGAGFYTELYSKVVGETGRVYMQNPAQFDSFIKDGLEERFKDGRLSNVTYAKTTFDGDMAPDGTVDVVTWVLGPHELWWTPDDEEPGVFGTPDTSFSKIADMLKPGGKFIAIDHSAPIDAPSTTGGDTHRISEKIIKDLAAKHGLEVYAESDVLRNADDDRLVQVFDKSIRRKTDRFVIKFVKK